MRKMRYEFPRTTCINDLGFIRLAKGFGKCYSLRAIEVLLIEIQDVSDEAMLHFPKYGRKRILIEDVHIVIQRVESKKCLGTTQIPIRNASRKNTTRCGRLRKLHLSYGLKREW